MVNNNAGLENYDNEGQCRVMGNRMVLAAVFLMAALAACSGDAGFCGQVSEIPKSECNALLAFYDNTSGSEWKDQRGWLTSRTPCSWFGVGCTDGHVTSIAINYNELTGNLPPELGKLSELKTLSLYFNHIEGTIPPELGELSELETLIIHNNGLSGSLPPELGDLTSLRKLDFDSNQLFGPIPPQFGNLSELRELMLRGNQLSGTISPQLAHLSKLEGLFLSNNGLSGVIPPEFAELSNLRMFSFYGNDLSGPLPASPQDIPSSGYDTLGWGDD